MSDSHGSSNVTIIFSHFHNLHLYFIFAAVKLFAFLYFLIISVATTGECRSPAIYPRPACHLILIDCQVTQKAWRPLSFARKSWRTAPSIGSIRAFLAIARIPLIVEVVHGDRKLSEPASQPTASHNLFPREREEATLCGGTCHRA